MQNDLEPTLALIRMFDPHLTTKIVSSYVRHHAVEAGQLSDLITSIHRSLGQLGRPNQPEEVLTPAVSCGNLYARTMWSASIAATGSGRCVGISVHSTV
jgi:ROS/MUCR transcriptional regulator protein